LHWSPFDFMASPDARMRRPPRILTYNLEDELPQMTGSILPYNAVERNQAGTGKSALPNSASPPDFNLGGGEPPPERSCPDASAF
jgi:hypothetical protein